jgi:2-amino-4-hydroxy-6-hydroxymethyldihydropteridine diphosphokinase
LACPFSFYCLQATDIEFKQLCHVLVCLGSGRTAEPRRARNRTSHSGRTSNKLEQIKGNIFIATYAKHRVIEGIHFCIFSEKDATRTRPLIRDTLFRMRIAYIGMGSNQPSSAGPPDATLAAAFTHLSSLGRIIARSSLYSTAPVGFADQPRFINAVVALETGLAPNALLGELLSIERKFGRDRSGGIPNGPRTLDLDILMMGDLCVRETGLEIPHPRLAERAFVLVPLNEVAPQAVDPVQDRSVAELLQRLLETQKDRLDAVVQTESDAWRTGSNSAAAAPSMRPNRPSGRDNR